MNKLNSVKEIYSYGFHNKVMKLLSLLY